jgi:hypothetical protein
MSCLRAADNLGVDHLDELRLSCARRSKRSPMRCGTYRLTSHFAAASMVAIREQIYFGWEFPLARTKGRMPPFGKYERDGWWSEVAAALVTSGNASQGKRLLERDQIEPVSLIVGDLLRVCRSPEETSELLQERLVTCTVLVGEHGRLGQAMGDGWQRYDSAGITRRSGCPRSIPHDSRR